MPPPTPKKPRTVGRSIDHTKLPTTLRPDKGTLCYENEASETPNNQTRGRGRGPSTAYALNSTGFSPHAIAELATARQYDLNVTWLIVDDGGYSILREYMTDTFGQATATELTRPDHVAPAESFGVPGVRTTPSTLEADLAKALAAPGPSVVVLPAVLRMFAPTHPG